jgi:hypothetical protein
MLKQMYERYRLFRANPCDVDGHSVIKPIGQALQALTSGCRCCDGARILLALGAGLLIGRLL